MASGGVVINVRSDYVGPILLALYLRDRAPKEDNAYAFVLLTAANAAAASVADKVFVQNVQNTAQNAATVHEFEIRTAGPLPPAWYEWHYLVIGTNKKTGGPAPTLPRVL